MVRRLDLENGQILAMGALLLTAFLAFVGLAIDAGFHYAERRQAQNGADEAALAGSFELAYGGSNAAAVTAALDNAAANGFDNNGTTNTVSVNIPPASGEFNGQAGHVQVIISAVPKTFFAHVLPGVSSGVAANGVANYSQSSGSGYAIFVDNNSCSESDALEVSGSDVDVDGLVHTNSHINVAGSGNDFDGRVSYSCGMDNSGSNNDYSPDGYGPLANQSFPVDYDYNDFPCDMEFTSDTDLASVAAAWVGGNPSSGQLIAGVYCSTAKLTLSPSDVTGTVTLAAQGEVVVSGSNFTLDPYWNDVLLYTPSSSGSALDVSASSGTWEGMLIAENGKAKIQGSANWTYSGSVLADTVQVSGSNFSLSAINYTSGGPATARLVE